MGGLQPCSIGRLSAPRWEVSATVVMQEWMEGQSHIVLILKFVRLPLPIAFVQKFGSCVYVQNCSCSFYQITSNRITVQ